MFRKKGSHKCTLTLVLLADLGTRDALAGLEACFGAAFLQVFKSLAGFGEVLRWEGVR